MLDWRRVRIETSTHICETMRPVISHVEWHAPYWQNWRKTVLGVRIKPIVRVKAVTMPNPGLGEEVVKVTLNLFKRDVEGLKKLYPNWSSEVRDIVRLHMRGIQSFQPKTLGDLDDQTG